MRSIWLIKKFVDKKARFVFIERGEFIEKGIPFDTPDAELRRYSNISAFESVVEKYNIKDKAVCKVADIMHDIEINNWGRKRFKESRDVIDSVMEIVNQVKSNEEIIKKCNDYLTAFIKDLDLFKPFRMVS